MGDKAEPEHACETCGSTVDVSYTADPYSEDVHGDDTAAWYCEYCLQASADDI